MIPDCLEHIGDNKYQCKKHGFIVEITSSDFTCGLCYSGPPIQTKFWHYTKAVAKHAIDGFKNVSEDEFSRRIRICSSCDKRVGRECTECGCPVDKKALWRSESCELGYWDQSGV